MKSTTGIKKTAKGKQAKVSNYKFWLVLSCVALVGVWYIILVLLSLGLDMLTRDALSEVSSGVYSFVSLFGSVAVMLLTSALSLPFANAVFKRLRVEKPIESGVALFMSVVFGLNLFVLITNFAYYGQTWIYTVLVVSIIFASLLYGLVIRPLKHKLTSGAFIATTVGLSLLPIALYLLWHLVLIKSI
jgi:hypothetical protein